ncbi:hypothetical protein ACFQL4_20275 [Halosimplex aquaticum]
MDYLVLADVHANLPRSKQFWIGSQTGTRSCFSGTPSARGRIRTRY